MTREEMIKRLDELETNLFILNMVDHWTAADFRLADEIEKEIKEIKNNL